MHILLLRSRCLDNREEVSGEDQSDEIRLGTQTRHHLHEVRLDREPEAENGVHLERRGVFVLEEHGEGRGEAAENGGGAEEHHQQEPELQEPGPDRLQRPGESDLQPDVAGSAAHLQERTEPHPHGPDGTAGRRVRGIHREEVQVQVGLSL